MRQALAGMHRGAQVLVRLEIVLLICLHVYFVITDHLPPIGLALIALVWIARRWTTGQWSRATLLDLPILLILLALPFSLWVSTNWWLSLPKVYGIILSIAFYYAIVNAIQSSADLTWALFWLVVVCVGVATAGLVGTDWVQGKIVSATVVYEHLPRYIQGIPRSIAGGFARNGVGGTVALLIPFLASLLIGKARAEIGGVPVLNAWLRPATCLALGLAVVALALTQSRGGWLGTGVGVSMVAIWRYRRVGWAVAAGIVAAGLIMLGAQGGLSVDALLVTDVASGTLASRLEVWQRGLWMIQDFPISGIGLASFNDIAHSMYPFFIAAPDELVSHSHNNLLQVAVDVGLPALVAFTAILTGFAICLWRAAHAFDDLGARALCAGLGFGMVAHQVFGVTDAFMVGTKPGVLVWVFFALAVVLHRMSRADTRALEGAMCD